MMIPEEWQVNSCYACKAKLSGDDFTRAGVKLKTPKIYVDYVCPRCKHDGRYLIPEQNAGSVSDLFVILATLCSAEKPRPSLNNIIGVNDFLGMGGTDAPKEP